MQSRSAYQPVFFHKIYLIRINTKIFFYIKSIIFRNYGDGVSGLIRFSSAEKYYSDYKTPSLFVNENYETGDIIIVDGPLFEWYLKYPKNYYLLKLDFNKFKNILESNDRVWIIYGMNIKNKGHNYINNNIDNFLNQNKAIYVGLDKNSKVYLFEN